VSALFVIVGGSIGALCRYWLGLIFLAWTKKSKMPLSMLIVNALGGLGLGVFYHFAFPLSSTSSLYLFVAIGFFGAFTTFSTFSVEAMGLLQKKAYSLFFVYILLSFAGTIGLFYLGFYGM
jgi:fluoride exporter